MRKSILGLVLVMSIVLSQTSYAKSKDECKRGTWKQENEKVYVCPNPGHSSWDDVSSEKEIKNNQKWQYVAKDVEFVKTSEYRLLADNHGSIIIVCNDQKKQISLAQNTQNDGMQSSYNVPLGYYFNTKKQILLCR